MPGLLSLHHCLLTSSFCRLHVCALCGSGNDFAPGVRSSHLRIPHSPEHGNPECLPDQGQLKHRAQKIQTRPLLRTACTPEHGNTGWETASSIAETSMCCYTNAVSSARVSMMEDHSHIMHPQSGTARTLKCGNTEQGNASPITKTLILYLMSVVSSIAERVSAINRN